MMSYSPGKCREKCTSCTSTLLLYSWLHVIMSGLLKLLDLEKFRKIHAHQITLSARTNGLHQLQTSEASVLFVRSQVRWHHCNCYMCWGMTRLEKKLFDMWIWLAKGAYSKVQHVYAHQRKINKVF
ncbi:hypothetical protein Dimus_025983 [Dionaea muscipula]